jgi:hypothetical protein
MLHQLLFFLFRISPTVNFQSFLPIGALRMSTQLAPPSFGGKLNTSSYYANVNSIISVLRGASTLRTIAAHLNGMGFLTPSGLVWSRERVATYIRNKSFN